MEILALQKKEAQILFTFLFDRWSAYIYSFLIFEEMWPALGDTFHSALSKCNHLIKTPSLGHALQRTGRVTHDFILHTVTLDGFDLIPAVNYLDSDMLQ